MAGKSANYQTVVSFKITVLELYVLDGNVSETKPEKKEIICSGT